VIGVAVVGTGFGQKVHIPGFQAHPSCEIVAVYHRNLEKAKTIAQTHNIPYAYSVNRDDGGCFPSKLMFWRLSGTFLGQFALNFSMYP
jgi:hypothetical protein